MNRERLKGHLDLLLMSVLAAGPAHGYAIVASLRDRSEGTFDLPEGTHLPGAAPARGAGPARQLLGQTPPAVSAASTR